MKMSNLVVNVSCAKQHIFEKIDFKCSILPQKSPTHQHEEPRWKHTHIYTSFPVFTYAVRFPFSKDSANDVKTSDNLIFTAHIFLQQSTTL